MAPTYKRVGFLADTHARKNDGSDVPEQVDALFAKVDLIVLLGDIGKKAFIPRLEKLAPVWVPDDERKGYIPFQSAAEPLKVIDVNGVQLGLVFNLAQPDKKIVVGDDDLTFQAPVPDLLKRRFKQPVEAVAFGGTHRQYQGTHDGVLFFNPGSPTLPSDSDGEGDLGSVAILDVAKKGTPKVSLLRVTAG